MNFKSNNRDDVKLICDIGELSGLFTDAVSLESFLQKICDMIAVHMNSDVCSIYLFYEDTHELLLKATKGLNQKFIDNVKLKLGEGLTGLALKELRPICERNASRNENFRYFPGLGEERFESFIAVPISRGSTMIGTMVIQNAEKNYFTDEDVSILRAITSQLANTIETTRLIFSLEEKHKLKKMIKVDKDLSFIKGKSGSSGYAFASAVTIRDEYRQLIFQKKNFTKNYTLKDFLKAVEVTVRQLETYQKSIEERLADVASMIFAAQILMLKDKSFIDSIVDRIKKGNNAPNAVTEVVKTYIKKFESLPNAYLREKAHDIGDIGRRLLENLVGKNEDTLEFEGCIVIARELFPSDALKLSSQNVKGIILLTGGVTSHLSILARSLNIPLIIADVPELLSVVNKTKVLMDAKQGNIYVSPSQEIIKSFKDKEMTVVKIKKLKKSVTKTTHTKDGTQVHLMANINLLGDVHSALEFKAEGVGLYRTEFPFIVRNNFPSEEEQYVIYKKLTDAMTGKEITFRTLDIGGDKVLSYFDHHLKEKNPYLGMRSIRFSLQHIDIFSQQIRAILRASIDSKVSIMFPMISSVDEFISAKKVVLDCIEALESEGIACHSQPKIGLMIELPSVLEVIEELAQEADYFSIGTNDFIQYMLAVDRTNEKVADLYLPHHPAILRALKRVVAAAIKCNREVSVCGDMVHEEKYLTYLLGIGVRKLSLNPSYIPQIQKAISAIDIVEAEEKMESIVKSHLLNDVKEMMDI